jgi:hypothetical protein
MFLFRLTKDLENNITRQEGIKKASYSVLWEIIPIFDYILEYFELLEIDTKASVFNNYPGIQNSIILVWNKTSDYYKKIDVSIAWVVSIVLYLR